MNQLLLQFARGSVGVKDCEVAEDGDVLRVSLRRGGGRLALSLFFVVPLLVLLGMTLASPGVALVVTTLLVGPVLAFLGVLFALAVGEKRVDRAARTCTNRFTLLGRTVAESQPIAGAAAVTLSRKALGSAQGAPGAALHFSIAVERCPGCEFTVFHDYCAALAFAERLATFLGLRVRDEVPEALRLKR